MPNVQWVHSLSAGVDGLVPHLRNCAGADKLPISNAKGAFDRSLAEWYLSLSLSLWPPNPRTEMNFVNGRCLAAFLHFNKQVAHSSCQSVCLDG